jgi:hypothetical protein
LTLTERGLILKVGRNTGMADCRKCGEESDGGAWCKQCEATAARLRYFKEHAAGGRGYDVTHGRQRYLSMRAYQRKDRLEEGR